MKNASLSLVFTFASALLLNLGNAQDSLLCQSLKTYPVLWHQTSAEYKALCYQAFNIASFRLDLISKKQIKKLKGAIITDIDETILNNSFNEAQLIKDNLQYSETFWLQWVNAMKAEAIPGSVDFLQKAKRKGIEIFYITNRSQTELEATISNLQILGFPDADSDHILTRSNSSSKEERRNFVSLKYKIFMLLGDNLNDFSNIFEKSPIASRQTNTEKYKELWGDRFIVIPNAIYGEWENALFNYELNLSENEKLLRLNKQLIGY